MFCREARKGGLGSQFLNFSPSSRSFLCSFLLPAPLILLLLFLFQLLFIFSCVQTIAELKADKAMLKQHVEEAREHIAGLHDLEAKLAQAHATSRELEMQLLDRELAAVASQQTLEADLTAARDEIAKLREHMKSYEAMASAKVGRTRRRTRRRRRRRRRRRKTTGKGGGERKEEGRE